MSIIQRLVNKVEILLANRTNKGKILYLKKKGACIGKDTILNCSISSFGTEPYLINIGDECLLAADVHLLTHDGGVYVLDKLGYFIGGGKNG